jgi:hypothetical protein
MGIAVGLNADLRDEAAAVKAWMTAPFSSAALDSERDTKIAEYQNLVKGEFETTAMFEQRKADAEKRIAAIRAEYDQKLNDARQAYENHISGLRTKLQSLLAQSRETVTMTGTLGSYDAETQRFKVSIPGKTFDIVVPLDKGPEVKSKFSNYELKVTRQLDENLEWNYLEARLVGKGGNFASTDKAPTVTRVAASTSIVPPNISASLSFSEPGGNDMLDAEETAQLTIAVMNGGKGPAQMVEASFDLGSIPGVSYPRSLYFGEIKAGETVSKSVQLAAGMDTKDAQAQLKVSFKEQNGFPPDDKLLSFSTRALQPPELYIADIGIADNSGNGKIEPGEQVEVRARIHNRGTGKAKNVTAEVIRGEGVFFVGDTAGGSFSLGDLEPGAYQDVVFNLVTAKTASKLDIRLDLKESRSQFSKLSQPLNLAFNRVERTAEQMIITGKDTQATIATAPSLSIDIEQDIPSRGKADKNRWGVIFGIESYRNVPSVRFAKRDAEYMKEYFLKVLGIPAENLYVKTDDGASLSELKTVFDPKGWLQKNAGNKNSEIYVYYSGHGVPAADGKKAYLLPWDGNPNYAENSAYALDQLYANLGALKVKRVTLFLDSCFSGANRDNEIILADARPVFISSALPSAAANLAVFSAASGSQISSAYGDQQHGLFSYFLMKGLRGEADANGDKKLTQQELNAYLDENVSSQARRMGREQDPELQSADPTEVLLQW